jgi:AraC family transcriptional regulator of adaptative response/methylated-DNA-[protein]-cysteine methyltransferase
MNAQKVINYNRIAEAITYIQNNFKERPNLDEVAKKVHLSPFHFQRLFTEWAGTSPKKFLQYISIEHAKKLLQEDRHVSVTDVAYETGLSGSSRLHDLFINIEGMTPAEYKNGGKSLVINYSFAESPFGNLIVAATEKGVCHMAFDEEEGNALHKLTMKFPNSTFVRKLDLIQQHALFIFQNDWSKSRLENYQRTEKLLKIYKVQMLQEP